MFGVMTTWKLKMTPKNGPVTERRGLSEEETLAALAELMYGSFDEPAEPAVAERRDDQIPLAA